MASWRRPASAVLNRSVHPLIVKPSISALGWPPLRDSDLWSPADAARDAAGRDGPTSASWACRDHVDASANAPRSRVTSARSPATCTTRSSCPIWLARWYASTRPGVAWTRGSVRSSRPVQLDLRDFSASLRL